MQKHKVIRLGIIGCGRVAQNHFQIIAKVSDVELAAAMDVDPSAARQAAETYGCKKWYQNYEELLSSKTLDAVIVCTPPVTHAPISIAALKKKIHVLCEKPFATTLKDARAMAEAACQEDTVLMMASKFRFTDDVIKAKGIIDSGILGQIVLFENIFCSKVDMVGKWNANPAISGGGVLIDNGTHSVDVARYLLGPIEKVQTQHGKQIQPIPVEDTSRLYFQTASGVLGIVDLSWSIYKETDTYIGVYGTEGTLLVGWKQSQYRQSEKMHWITFGTGYSKEQAFQKQLEYFVHSIRQEEKPLMNLVEDAVESVRVIETVYRSAIVDKWMVLDKSPILELT